MGTSLPEDKLNDKKEQAIMSKSEFKVSFDAKNVVVDFGPTKPPHPDDKYAPPLKRRAPKTPKKKAKRTQAND